MLHEWVARLAAADRAATPLMVATTIHNQLGVTGPPMPDGLIYSLSRTLKVRLVPMEAGLYGVCARHEPEGSVLYLSSALTEPRRRLGLWTLAWYWLTGEGPAWVVDPEVTQGASVGPELAAREFARAVLMPREWLERDLAEGRSFAELPGRYRVPRGTLRRQVLALGIDTAGRWSEERVPRPEAVWRPPPGATVLP